MVICKPRVDNANLMRPKLILINFKDYPTLFTDLTLTSNPLNISELSSYSLALLETKAV